MTTDAILASLDAILAALDEYATANPGRVEQARSHIVTARMAVGFIATENPY